MDNKNIWLIHTKQDPIKGQLLLRHIWKGTPNECRSLWRFDEDVVIGGTRQYTTLNGSFRDVYTSFKAQYLYVTSKDPYQKGGWVKNVTIEAEPPFKLDVHGIRYTQLAPCKFEKIVLTTDDYLIQDGIHSVEDDFLDWFCKNSTCQSVEFTKNYLSNDGQWKEVLLPSEWEVDTKVGYKIIIPKEEPLYDYGWCKGNVILPKEEPKQDWYCPKCNSYVSAESVTFEETHQICNTSVIVKEEPKTGSITECLKKLIEIVKEK
jgi:hypothetical protein